MNLKTIQRIFKNRSLEKRIEFLETYDFIEDEETRSYLTMLILNQPLTSNIWYEVLMVELSSKLNLVSDEIFVKYSSLFGEKGHYLLKLAILDYFTDTYSEYLKMGKEFSFLWLENLYEFDRLIVKSQAFLLWMLLSSKFSTDECGKFLKAIIYLVDRI